MPKPERGNNEKTISEVIEVKINIIGGLLQIPSFILLGIWGMQEISGTPQYFPSATIKVSWQSLKLFAAFLRIL